MDKKVVSLFSGKSSTINSKYGFSYVTFENDAKGIPFNEEQMYQYKSKMRYFIRIARKHRSKVFLDNYDVSSDKIDDFFSKYNEGYFEGTIIEIDKYEPQSFA